MCTALMKPCNPIWSRLRLASMPMSSYQIVLWSSDTTKAYSFGDYTSHAFYAAVLHVLVAWNYLPDEIRHLEMLQTVQKSIWKHNCFQLFFTHYFVKYLYRVDITQLNYRYKLCKSSLSSYWISAESVVRNVEKTMLWLDDWFLSLCDRKLRCRVEANCCRYQPFWERIWEERRLWCISRYFVRLHL